MQTKIQCDIEFKPVSEPEIEAMTVKLQGNNQPKLNNASASS